MVAEPKWRIPKCKLRTYRVGDARGKSDNIPKVDDLHEEILPNNKHVLKISGLAVVLR
jgi:hypothetical protein